MTRIESIGKLRVFNSHVEPTTEFTVRLEEGTCGRAASPHGETIGVYEQESVLLDPSALIDKIRDDGVFGQNLDQESFDRYLHDNAGAFGKNNSYALSLAFYEAGRSTPSCGPSASDRIAPRLCCNILNGGWHAYTNPVLSDFPEYILVAMSHDIEAVLGAHAELQGAVHEALKALPKIEIAGNPVSRFGTKDNRECIEFLLDTCDRLGLSGDFELMIDAAAAGLQTDGGYRFAITDGAVRSADELCDYWLGIIKDYGLGFLEDPFGEQDAASWAKLTTSGGGTCRIIGDDFYCSDAERIRAGAQAGLTHGVLIKPNQAGSVTAVLGAIHAASSSGLLAIASHRSVSTETPFEATLACLPDVPFIKIGPLITDYSSVIRLNEIIRLTATE